MPEYFRALLFVLIISAPVFFVARKVSVPLIDDAEFKLWRNCWIAATFFTFLSSSFFDFAAAMALMSVYIFRNSKQPALFYLILMFVAPCVQVGVGIPGIMNRITDLDPPRLLALLILLPMAIRLLRDPESRKTRFPDLFVLSFFALIAVLAFRLPDFNEVLRSLMGHFLDFALPYFVFSRAIRSGTEANRVLLAFAVAAMPLAAVGALEILKSWRIYYQVILEWGVIPLTPYLFRDGLLRAATTSVEAIAYGFMCMTGAACMLAVRTPNSSGIWRLAALAILLLGLLSSVSRGPWLGFVICVLVVLATNVRLSMKLGFAAVPALCVLLAVNPPFLNRFVNLLPFVGSADVSSETYRSALFENALIVIDRYPIFGSETFLREPEMLRMIQGQGIIDVVNSYLQVALYYGLVGLLLFVMVFGMLAVRLGIALLTRQADSIHYPAILGLLIGMLFTIATTSSVTVITYIYWTYLGLGSSIIALVPRVKWQHTYGIIRKVGNPEPALAHAVIAPEQKKMQVLSPG